MYLVIIEQPHSACLNVLGYYRATSQYLSQWGYYRATSQCLSQCTWLLQSNLRVSVSVYLVIIEQPHSVCLSVLGYYRATSECLSQCTWLL